MTKFLHITSSKDRGPQLEAFLRTFKFLKGSVTNKVLYTTSTSEHEEVYLWLQRKYPDIEFVKEYNYKVQFESLIESSDCKYAFFTSDDDCFLRDIDLFRIGLIIGDQNLVYSLRLGTHLNCCHPAGNTPQSLPAWQEDREEFKIWSWKGSSLDWSYLMSYDGHVYIREGILQMLKQLDYQKPTSVEIGLQRFIPNMSETLGACKRDAQLVSVPWNNVTDQANNLNTGISEQVFLDEWNKGKRICLDHIVGSMPVSCHYEYDLIWEGR